MGDEIALDAKTDQRGLHEMVKMEADAARPRAVQ